MSSSKTEVKSNGKKQCELREGLDLDLDQWLTVQVSSRPATPDRIAGMLWLLIQLGNDYYIHRKQFILASEPRLLALRVADSFTHGLRVWGLRVTVIWR